MNYYNTTHESGQLLLQYEYKAISLERIVLELFKMQNKPLTWSDVHLIIPNVNEVSLKRSITNLKTSGHLEKTKEKGISIYGKPAYKYRLI
jgi:hypothetical protein